jgi:iron-sulfur cluster repair protein YtfE (RIC family)
VDVIQLLTDQHRMLEERLEAAVSARDPRERAALGAEAGDQLAIHVSAEEEILYPALRACGVDGLALELLDDHAALKQPLRALIGCSADNPAYERTVAALRAEAERHHADEEAHLFPWLARAFSSEARETLGRQILSHQKNLLRAGQPRCATPEPALPALATA